jgi:hypothetical protein
MRNGRGEVESDGRWKLRLRLKFRVEVAVEHGDGRNPKFRVNQRPPELPILLSLRSVRQAFHFHAATFS